MNYQQSTQQTAIYPKERGLEYCIYGLIGEVGELANKYKKVIRDCNGILDQPTKDVLIGELGDVCWYISQLANESGFDLVIPDITTPTDQPILELAYVAGLIASDIRNITVLDLQDLLGYCISIAEDMLDTTLTIVMDRNIEKLFSRKERGVLGGSGDNR